MTLINDITQLLQQYDAILKVAGVIAAPGGIWFWVDKYRSRIRVNVRNFSFASSITSASGLTFEAENISSILTSLEPIFFVTSYTLKREKRVYKFKVEGDDRQLLPHLPKKFVGLNNNAEDQVMHSFWYMTVTIPLTRGRCQHLRFRNAKFERLGAARFHYERLFYVCFDKSPD